MSPDPAAAAHAAVEAVESWTEALERLESGVRQALAGAEPDSAPWTPPVGLGPLPEELRERAARLLDAQRHTVRHLEDVRQTTARHLAAVRSVPRDDAGHGPVYFDLIG